MTFLQPALLIALPLAALPVLIHLIHLFRRRQVPWAAMMFLRMAQRMNKGLSRLKQLLILALRVLAVAALIFVITRPLAGGWLGLTGGAPDTVMILIDRSASMEQRGLTNHLSKREAGLRNIAKAIDDAVATRSRLVLIDSATMAPLPVPSARILADLPQTDATDTAADITALLQGALDYITANQAGRTDVWLLSDLQQTDWDAGSGRWEALRLAFAALPGVRFHILGYAAAPADDLGVAIDSVARRETPDKAELLFDLRVTRSGGTPAADAEVPLRFVIDGASTTLPVTLKDGHLVVQALTLPIDKTAKRGWGRVELPGDAWAANNIFHFVFDEPPPLRSIIISADEANALPLQAALSAAADPAREYAVSVLPPERAAEIPWEDAALIVWHAPLPSADEPLAGHLQEHAASGRSLLFLPPDSPGGARLFGLGWGQWRTGDPAQPGSPGWWRNDTDVLENTRDGAALPVGELELLRHCEITGDGTVLARLADHQPLLLRSAQERRGGVYFLGTLPGSGASSLARDGVVMYAMLHRMLAAGVRHLGTTRQQSAAADALGTDPSVWQPADEARGAASLAKRALVAGVLTAGDRMVALNRPAGEDDPRRLGPAVVDELFAGLDYRLLTGEVDGNRSLTSEVWRAFLMAMALALLAEALLCLPAGQGRVRSTAVPAAAA